MADYSKGITDRFNKMSDEQLLVIIKSKSGEYTAEALDIAMSIIENRGGIDIIKSRIEEKQKQEKEEALRIEKIGRKEAEERKLGELKESKTGNDTSNNENSGVLLLSGILMAILGIVVSIFLFSHANSVWGGLDNRIIIGGFVILTYQAIISFLCFKVDRLSCRVAKLENMK